MNNKCKVTVAVISYNPVWEKLRNTLKSIVWQQNIDFEIIVADDGSENDCFDLVENFLKEKKFTNYKLIKNPLNQGIVKNVLSAVNVAEGKYIKLISPGDFLYDQQILDDIVQIVEKNPADAYFCDAIYYSVDNNKKLLKFFPDKRSPKFLKPFHTGNIKKLRRNYFMRNDFICGATMFMDRSILLEYLNKISEYSKYTEDLFYMYMIAENKKIFHINKNCVFYEYGEGVSTSNSALKKLLLKDISSFLLHLYMTNKITKAEYVLCSGNANVLKRFFYRIINDPIYLLDAHTFRLMMKVYNNYSFEDEKKLKIILYS